MASAPPGAILDRPAARWSALDDVANLGDVRRVVELDADAGKNRHQTLAEGLELVPRVPDLADLKVPIRTEADVVVEASGWPFASVLDLANRLVVNRAVRAMGLKRTTMLMI